MSHDLTTAALNAEESLNERVCQLNTIKKLKDITDMTIILP